MPRAAGPACGSLRPRPAAGCAQPVITANERELREVSRSRMNIRLL
jgi:hypothetical protein